MAFDPSLRMSQPITAAPTPAAPSTGAPDPLDTAAPSLYGDEELKDLWSKIKQESFDGRWSFERQWQRNIWYVLGRQWIEYQSKLGGWRDKRMASWMPRPVTNQCKKAVQAIRAMFTSITLGVNVRPNGVDPKNVSAAATADALAPVLHSLHHMNTAMTEFDFWLIVTGNAFIHTYVDYDIKHGAISVASEECQTCFTVTTSDKLTGAQPICPNCQGTSFAPALDETGAPIVDKRAKGKPSTLVLSPLEVAFSQSHSRFEELPYIVRCRWRTKRYIESQPKLKGLSAQITWQKAPQGQSLAMFQALSQANDLGVTPTFLSEGSSGSSQEEGIPEYETWMKPCAAYPDGLVFRMLGDSDPLVVHLEDEEALPGPLPYKDADGNPLFPWAHAPYEQVGGRILGSGPIDLIIQKQDQLNQLDSHVLLSFTRMANPVWMLPKGSAINKFTGMPGLVCYWDPLTVGGNAKPERIPGVPVDQSAMALREQYLNDIQDLIGTYSVIEGNKPAGVEAFSAIQSLIELSHSRFSSVFQARGEVYRSWFAFALELEREFGPDDYTKAVQTPARGWTFKNFKRAQLQGSVTVIVEDGSTTPKTSLGMRASVEHANTLGMLDMTDPDQQYEGLKLFGLTRMVPTLDIHVQAALQKQDAFEQWVVVPAQVQQWGQISSQVQAAYQKQVVLAQQGLQAAATDPNAPMPQPLGPPPDPLEGTPLEWLPWFRPQVHRQEFMKWANGDAIKELRAKNPVVKQFLVMHLAAIDQAVAKEVAVAQAALAPMPQQAKAAGASRAMKNSNDNSAPAGNKAQQPAEPGKQNVPPPA